MVTTSASIPETGGSNRSPLRNDLVNLVHEYLNGNITVINGKLEATLRSIELNMDKPWLDHTSITLNMLDNDFVNSRTKESISVEYVNEVNVHVADLVLKYVSSYGVTINKECRDKIKDVVRSFDIYDIIEFRKYRSLQILLGRTEKLKITRSTKEIL